MSEHTDKERGFRKLKHIQIETQQVPHTPQPNKPKIRPSQAQIERVAALKKKFRKRKLVTVCEEANCPNLTECFSHQIATFMIMGDKCTRRCAFCDVAHGKPDPLNPDEPLMLAETIQSMNLKYVVVTSVDRDDLLDGGAQHFSDCIEAIRTHNPGIKVEILVPDFKKRMDRALKHLKGAPPDVFNHNIETIPRLYKTARAGSDYQHSLNLLAAFKEQHPNTPTKSGIMVGLGENNEELYQVFKDLIEHKVSMLTIGQYLAPSKHHMPVHRYMPITEFEHLKDMAYQMGFKSVASGPLVRSSYHADQQAQELDNYE